MRSIALSLLAAAPQQSAVERNAEVPSITIEVLDAATKQPLPGAEVTWATKTRRDAELARRWCGIHRGFDPIELDEVARTVGATAVADAAGRVTIAKPDEPFRIVAGTEDRYATRLVEMAELEIGVPLVVACEPREVLDVYVVDADGTPIGGIPVAAGWYPRLPTDELRDLPVLGGLAATMDNAWPAGFDGVVSSRTDDGRARFTHANGWLSPDDAPSRTVVFAFPVVLRVELRFDGEHAQERHELQLPPLGRVVLEFPGVEQGVAQLRNAATGRGGTPLFWRDYEPARAPIVQAKATFPFVGLGTKLEYRATWPGLATPITGTLDGPRREGQTVEFTAGGRAEQPIIAGRLVDEDGQPISSCELQFHTNVSYSGPRGSGGRGDGTTLTTRDDGRFELNLELTYVGDRRLVQISEPWWTGASKLDHASATLDFTAPVAAGIHELGDVVLRRPGSRGHLRSVSDVELEQIFDRARDGIGWTEDATHDADVCLTEMIERGGDRWIAYLQRQFDPPEIDDEESEDRGRTWKENITLLTALRRAQRKPDPCLLAVGEEGLFVSTFPDSPTIQFRLKNVDELGVELRLLSYELRGRDYCRATVHDETGAEVPRHAPPFTSGGGLGLLKTIEPGESLESSLELGDLCFLPRSGDYRVRIHQRHGRDGSQFSRSKGPLDGWIVSSSPEFTVRVKPREIRLAADERKRLRAQFDAIDLSQPCPFSVEHWSEEKAHPVIASSPVAELLRVGWTAVPMLLDVLDDERASPRARGWALALLFDITGVVNPEPREGVGWSGEIKALGPYMFFPRWPAAGNSGGDGRVLGPREPDAAAQIPLIRRWAELRANLSIVD